MIIDMQKVSPPEAWGVTIDETALRQSAQMLAGSTLETPGYDYEGIPRLEGESWARFVILGVSVVWRLWAPEPEPMWSVEIGGERLEDAPAIWACFAREPASLDLEWHAAGGARRSEFFRGEGHLQDVERRYERLEEVSGALLKAGSALSLIGDGNARRISEALIDTIPGYHDRVSTEIGELRFDKLANLATAMLAARLPIEGVEDLGVYPDYMLPRALRHMGILVYSGELARAVDQKQLIPKESQAELAVRWGTIHACERLLTELRRNGADVTAPQIDYYLWHSAVLGPDADSMGEHHLTLTEAY